MTRIAFTTRLRFQTPLVSNKKTRTTVRGTFQLMNICTTTDSRSTAFVQVFERYRAADEVMNFTVRVYIIALWPLSGSEPEVPVKNPLCCFGFLWAANWRSERSRTAGHCATSLCLENQLKFRVHCWPLMLFSGCFSTLMHTLQSRAAGLPGPLTAGGAGGGVEGKEVYNFPNAQRLARPQPRAKWLPVTLTAETFLKDFLNWAMTKKNKNGNNTE